MDMFEEALLSGERNKLLPAEDDWLAPLLGDWDFDYSEPNGRKVKGEWLLRRALDGMAVEDLFICPSRATREVNPQPDGEYGAAIRMYHPEKRRYDMTYVCAGYTTRLEVCGRDGRIVCTVCDDPTAQWVFSEISPQHFHWRNLTVKDGEARVNCELYATRRA